MQCVIIQRALEELYPEEINHGRLYPSLDRLVNSGLLSTQMKESDERRKNMCSVAVVSGLLRDSIGPAGI